MDFIYNDGGRADAGYKGATGDCFVRAVVIVTGKPYREVYDAVNEIALGERTGKRKRGKSDARTGTYKYTEKKYLESLGFKWTPTMFIGQGCKVHMKASELPMGKLLVHVSRHYVAVIDRAMHDIYDCSREETRCVYGYWK